MKHSIDTYRFDVLLVLFLIHLLFVFTFSGNATTYFVSTSGNDANPGTSEDLPWKSLARVNNFFKLYPGDQVLFKRGDEWSGTVTVRASGTAGSPIIYGAYGTGDKPKIYGSEIITGWTLHSGNIYKASLNTTITQLFVNGQRARAARYPNTGWLNVTTVSGKNQFTSAALTNQPNNYYKGANLLIKTREWRLESRQIKSSNGQLITFDSALSYSLDNNISFFLTNKLEFLDEAGEWFYDYKTHSVYLWSPNGDSPSNYEIRGSVNDDGVVIENKRYVIITNLNILQQKVCGINAYYTSNSNITIDNNNFSDIESIGITSRGENNIIQNNKLNGINAVGINNLYSPNGVVENNEILNTALLENLGVNGMYQQQTSMAISVGGNDQSVRYNRIINAAYIGIRFQGLNTLIENNFIDNVCTLLFDGAAIYTYASSLTDIQSAGSVVKNNIVVYPNGSAGIAMDNFTQGVLIEGNTIAYGTGSRYYAPNTFCIAIGLNDNKNIKVRNNMVFSNTKGLRILKGYTGNEFTGNIVCNIPTTPNNPYGFSPLLTEQRDIGETVKWDYNIYIDRTRPHAFRRQQSGIYDNYNLTDWTFLTGQDANSTFIGTALNEGETEKLFYNDTKQNKTFNMGESVFSEIFMVKY